MSSKGGGYAQGKYTGNGGSGPIDLKPGFQPKKIKIISANGKADMFCEAGGSKVFKQVAAGTLTVLTAGIAVNEFGAQITGSDAVLNANGVEYYYEME